ncbi:type-F conjugative transfer system secretin TraK [Vibrio neptunius]|uniref:Type-F conjugative transfer system secretin TraK n=1 Tax=Vibrio neptunius TaxID=170651 RepID=A0ABS3A8X7_9VIBR|nr:type-F conjugative transfer system secretin TraK [Vibrio neptunius]MBN3495485.1 type-F conjugative transfer system secretin TraK [Vibrio neptunius]MBN3517489.1 type-F conjugative transfer system secretin TraK [Vibrio neptunius]MBN3551828.1 type-F conjugative transfer system secretin TraK [Vibrio neptunius]MBN3580321.1 type-F conjugative transfer system secretin TraK [Vibrio neptunius]MCH9873987.1 type-F conjugative transfer system secretin TraK [Vibrio neptunius]
MKHLSWLMAVLFTFLSPFALANNVQKATFPFADGDTIPVSLSSVNINRLVVEGDKILNITCPQGFCTTHGIQKDKTGSVSLKLNVALPFTAHVLTQKGRLFALFITPKATPGIVTAFTPTDQHLSRPSLFERGFDYPSAIANFTKAMMLWKENGTAISGFRLHSVDPKTLPKKNVSLPVIPQTVFVGRDYSGIIYQIKNQSSDPVTLTTAQFYSYAARSAALDKYQLAPNETTYLYVVTGGGVSDVR